MNNFSTLNMGVAVFARIFYISTRPHVMAYRKPVIFIDIPELSHLRRHFDELELKINLFFYRQIFRRSWRILHSIWVPGSHFGKRGPRHRVLWYQCVFLHVPQVRQVVRILPCGHQFHAACVSQWLLHTSDSCPVDGAPVAPILRHRALQWVPFN